MTTMADDEVRFQKAFEKAMAVAGIRDAKKKVRKGAPYYERTPWFMLHMDKKYRGTDHAEYLAKAEVEAEDQHWAFKWKKDPGGKTFSCILHVKGEEGWEHEEIPIEKAKTKDQRRLIQAEMALEFADW